jgi:hypothetical protein
VVKSVDVEVDVDDISRQTRPSIIAFLKALGIISFCLCPCFSASLKYSWMLLLSLDARSFWEIVRDELDDSWFQRRQPPDLVTKSRKLEA